ncbi:MAG: hypothetical protein QM758_25015 [Armatimonas sp.]
MTVRVQAPVRIDFGGAWTDVGIYANEHGGAVFNATIDQYALGTFEVRQRGEGVEAREGLSVNYGFDLPSGSGLGTSAALNVVWLALIGGGIREGRERGEIAEQAYRIEEVLGNLGGKQDQWASALGGFNLLRFSKDGVETQSISLSPETLEALQSRSVLVYTGTPRLSGRIHESVWGAYQSGRPETVAALHRLKEIALTMPGKLNAGDVDGFAALLAENWTCQKALYDSVTNPQIERLFTIAREAGAVGGKACGAGGGGCLYFISSEGKRDSLAAALATAGAREIPFRFEFDGLTVKG